MITTLHASRSGLRGFIGRASMSLALVALLLVAATQARAVVSYSYSGSHSLTWTTNSWKYLSISRTGGYTPLTVNAFLTGSSKFSLNTSTVYFEDSSKDTGYMFPRSIGVSFNSTANDTCVAWLILYDNNRSDTIMLTGYGTLDTRDFTVTDTNINIVVHHDSSGGPVVAVGSDAIKNMQGSAISVSAFVLDSTNFSLDNTGGHEIFSLAANAPKNFSIYYTGSGVYQTSTKIYLYCYSPYYQLRIITVNVTDPTLVPKQYEPTVVAPWLGYISAGDSACGLVTVTNKNAQAITITYMSGADSLHWSTSGRATTPLVLQPNGTTTFTVCYHSTGNDMNTAQYDNIYVRYRDSSGVTGTVSATASVWVRDFVDAHDTTALDDVVLGGFVDASAFFVVHKSARMTAGTGVVYQGGSVQILSPALPDSIHAGDTVEVRFRVKPNPDSGSFYEGYIPIHIGSWNGEIAFYGKVVVRTSNDSTHGLSIYANQSELIAMRTSNTVVVDTFWFANNYGGNTTVSNATLSTGAPHFFILGYVPHGLPVTLSANQSMGIIIQFKGDTLGYYHDSLYIESSNSLTTTRIDVEAIMASQNGAGVARTAPATGAALFVSPNPANGPVQIAVDGARTATIEVYDLLGVRILSMPNMTQASWNADAIGGGAYIVRATGVDAQGHTYSITKRLILVK